MYWGLGLINAVAVTGVAILYSERQKLAALGHSYMDIKLSRRMMFGIGLAVIAIAFPNLIWAILMILVSLVILKSSQKQRERYYTTQSFYKIYKYFQIQIETGARPEEILKSLFRIVEYPKFKEKLFHFSAIISQSHDVQQGLDYLKSQITDAEGKIFISITENIVSAGGKQETFSRLNYLMFQKYLSNIREDTKRIKRKYLYAVILFTTMVTMMLLIPLINEMMVSTKMIFN